jgi:ABC-type transport system substrate-binding protein
MFIRTSRGDQLDFATSARDQLAACGIELVVRELDLSGGALLDQLQWPNDFDTVFLSRELGADPDVDLSPYESRHVTTAENPGDTGIGGWSDPRMDAVLGEARRSADVTTRTQLYREAQAILARDVPVLPLWYQRTYAGLSARVAGAERTIDLTSADYAWDVDTWQLINQ